MRPMDAPADAPDWVDVVRAPLPVSVAIGWATTPAAGAVVTFQGVVRNHSEGRSDVTSLTYEAYEERATDALRAVAAEARRRWPEVDRLAVLHRLGDLHLSECSVLVVASSPHRPDAFEAARFCIDTLKESAPILKREHWVGGSGWATCDHGIRPAVAADLPRG